MGTTSTIKLDEHSENLIKQCLPANDILYDLSCFFSAFSDATRVKLITVLCMSEMCVNDISAVVRMNQSTVSHQLRILKDIGIVKSRRLGKIIFYSLKSKYIEDVMNIGVKHLGL
ncbi:MAG: ArsR/SmtB family transcription factor [Christensenellales bacterium]|jgi:DNA-binding transcriptional ArsR family regulator